VALHSKEDSFLAVKILAITGRISYRSLYGHHQDIWRMTAKLDYVTLTIPFTHWNAWLFLLLMEWKLRCLTRNFSLDKLFLSLKIEDDSKMLSLL